MARIMYYEAPNCLTMYPKFAEMSYQPTSVFPDKQILPLNNVLRNVKQYAQTDEI